MKCNVCHGFFLYLIYCKSPLKAIAKESKEIKIKAELMILSKIQMKKLRDLYIDMKASEILKKEGQNMMLPIIFVPAVHCTSVHRYISSTQYTLHTY